MQPSSAEYTVTRTYLEWLVELPWTVETEDKLDIQEGKWISSFFLSERSPLVPSPPLPSSGLDGCLAEHVLQDAAAKKVYVVVPTETRVGPGGTRDFQLLTFALPDWTFVSAQSESVIAYSGQFATASRALCSSPSGTMPSFNSTALPRSSTSNSSGANE